MLLQKQHTLYEGRYAKITRDKLRFHVSLAQPTIKKCKNSSRNMEVIVQNKVPFLWLIVQFSSQYHVKNFTAIPSILTLILCGINRDVFEDSMVEAKAKAKARGLRGQGQGHKILSSRCPPGRGQSSRNPIPGLFTAQCYSSYATSSVCPSLSNSTPYCRLLCLCIKYCIYGIEAFTY